MGRRFDEVIINEVSLTSNPCNEESIMTLKKSLGSGEKPDSLKKNDIIQAVSTNTLGHSHSVSIDIRDGALYMLTSYEESQNISWHDHRIIRLENGDFQLVERLGHTHLITEQAVRTAIEQILAKNGETRDLEGLMKNFIQEDYTMNDKEKMAVIEKMSKEVFGHYRTLSKTKQTEFLRKTVEEMEEIVAKAAPASENATPTEKVEKSTDNEDLAKSNSELKKQLDEVNARLAKADEEKLRKSVETDYSHLPGDVDTKVEIIKAVRAHLPEDEEFQKNAEEFFKAHNPAGSTAVSVPFVKSEDGTLLEGEEAFEKKVEEIRKANPSITKFAARRQAREELSS